MTPTTFVTGCLAVGAVVGVIGGDFANAAFCALFALMAAHMDGA